MIGRRFSPLLPLFLSMQLLWADEPINLYLRPHFTLAFRSRDAFRPIDRIPAGAAIRKVVWDYPLAQFVAQLKSDLPENVSFCRTYLRCRPLGWHYGGHAIDVLPMDAVDFEGVLLLRGESLNRVEGTSILQTKRNEFVLADQAKNQRVASLSVPGGFEGKSGQILQALQTALQDQSFERTGADWMISFRPAELLDRHLWDAIPIGLSAMMQPRDHETEVTSVIRQESVRLLIEFIRLFASDVETCQLTADLDEENQSANVRLIMTAKPDSKLMQYFELMSHQTVVRPTPIRHHTPAVLGILGIPPSEAISQSTVRLKTPWPGASDSSRPTHIVFGICSTSNSRQHSEVFAALCDSAGRRAQLSGSRVHAAIAGRLSDLEQLRLLSPDSSDFPASRLWLTEIQTTEDESSEIAIGLPEEKFLFAECRISQLVPLFYPELLETVASLNGQDVVKIHGDIEKNRAVIQASFPPHTDQYVYLLFEQVLHSLKQLSQSLPFEAESP